MNAQVWSAYIVTFVGVIATLLAIPQSKRRKIYICTGVTLLIVAGLLVAIPAIADNIKKGSGSQPTVSLSPSDRWEPPYPVPTSSASPGPGSSTIATAAVQANSGGGSSAPPPGRITTSPPSGRSVKAVACDKLASAAFDEAGAIQALHNSVRADTDAGQIVAHDGDFFSRYDAANAAVTTVSQRISDYKKAGGGLPPDPNFEYKTNLMLSHDLPALQDGVKNGTTEAAYNAWNELTQYAQYARDVATMNCGQ